MASLEKWKVYPVIEKERDMIRIIDEDGEDYLFTKEYFAELSLPLIVQKA